MTASDVTEERSDCRRRRRPVTGSARPKRGRDQASRLTDEPLVELAALSMLTSPSFELAS